MPKKIAFLFPGQGSQVIGMGKAWAESSTTARAIFNDADSALGRSLSKVCFDGPEDELKLTANTQPGLYLCGVVGAALLKERGVTPDAVAGHSLGEYAALASAGVFPLEEGLRLVGVRGDAMNEASEATDGAMAAILGMDDAAALAACEEASSAGIVKPANFNGPGQIVISGDKPGVDAAIEACRAAGAKRAISLPVHGAFHSPLMETAVPKMTEALATANLSDPTDAFYANVTGDIMTGAEDIRVSLADQITSPVRWTEIIEKLIASGVELYVEIGPGKVLSGIMKRMDRSATCIPCSTPEDIDKVVEAAG